MNWWSSDQVTYLEDHLNGKYTSESIIEIVEDLIPKAALFHRIFSGQGDAAQTDDYHDEEIEVRQIHHPVSGTSNPVSWEFTPRQQDRKYMLIIVIILDNFFF